MAGTCLIALASLAIALYVQARCQARSIRRRRKTRLTASQRDLTLKGR